MREEKMTNCPKCQKPILNGGLFTSPAKFNIRCPWCQATLQINIQPKIVTEVIKLGNGEPVKPPFSPGEAGVLEDEWAKFSAAGIEPLNNPTAAENRLPASELRGPQAAKGFRLVGYLYPEEPKPS